MKAMHRISGDFAGRRSLRYGQRAQEVDIEAPANPANPEMVELYAEIEYALPSDRGMVVQFVSATSGFGSDRIPRDMVWTAVSVLGKRILLINCTQARRALPRRSSEVSADEPAGLPADVEDGMVKVRDREMYMTDLRGWQTHTGALISTDEIEGQIDALRGSFDMIVMVAPPADSDPLAAVMARYADGNIMLVEAEETRQAEAVRLREILSRSGRPIIGAILNNRRNYIPRWLARYL